MTRIPPRGRRGSRAAVNVLVFVAVLIGIRFALGPGARGEDVSPPAEDSPAPPVAALVDRPPMVLSADQIEDVEDPAILYRAGEWHLAKGDAELARKCFEAGLQHEELNHYINFVIRDAFRALLHERMGETAEASAAWKDGIDHDLHYSYIFCRLLSRDPGKEQLLESMREELARRIEAVKAGEEVHWYTTKKGASRKLSVLTQEDLIKQASATDGSTKTFKYVYIPELDLAALPADWDLAINRSVIGSLRGYGAERTGSLGITGFVVDECHLGKKWKGRVNLSSTIPPATLGEVFLMELVVLADAHMEGIKFQGRNASFVFSVFEGEADFSTISVGRTADFRYCSFRHGVNFRRSVFEGPAHFGHSAYGGPTDFSATVCSTRRAWFNSTRFGSAAVFEKLDWRQGGTFEDAHFAEELVLSRGRFGARMNLSRARLDGGLDARELVADGMDFFGAQIGGSSDFTDSVFDGHVRFSPDEVTYREFAGRLDELHKLYKIYQGDEDASEDLTTKTAYGVESIDDLTASIPGDVSFANVMFAEFCQFQRVVFGRPGQPGTVDFYNAQFRGETHFERAVFHSDADFTTIFANELGLNDAIFHGRVMLDDANVPGRVTMGGARFLGIADLSLYGAQISRFHISKDQLREDKEGQHRLFYERCAQGRVPDVEQDPRIDRAIASTPPGQEPPEVVDLCYERLCEDFNVLGNAFAERGMPPDEDWAYWYGKHHETMHAVWHGGITERVQGFGRWFLFELMFGWGVKLQNLLLASLVVVLVFGLLYKWICPEAHIEFNGFETQFKHLTYTQAFFLSMMSLLSMDIGWDIGRNKYFRWLNVLEVLLGVIILTFFVGAYTRLVLA